MAIYCGLGNPGQHYQNTPHNVGFLLADAIASAHNAPWKNDARWQAAIAKITVSDTTHWLLKPQTFMNLSGEALAAFARFHKIPPQECLVGVDDIELPAGTLRLRQRGGTGGHNGLKSIETHLGTQDYPRLRIGVAPDPRPPAHELADYVLCPWDPQVKEAVFKSLPVARSLVLAFFRGGYSRLAEEYSRLKQRRP